MLENIFISYHFDDDAQKIADKVKRLVVSHKIKPVDGERLGGANLGDGVKDKINDCQAIIIILTKREAGKTNDWVRDERAYAEGRKLKIITLIENDPSDLPRARKFLKVYLDGTRRVTESYAKTHRNEATTVELDSNFSNVLNSIESTFDEQHEKLKKQDQFDLDVNIEVLETQLKREGII